MRTALRLANGMGFLKKLPADETVYQASYEKSVKAMEKALGLNADGVLQLSELAVLDGTLYTGRGDLDAAPVLERLKDLGYLSKLAEEHHLNGKDSSSGVKKAEKALKLKADGFLTPEEQETVLAQKTKKPAKAAKVKAKASNETVTVSWSAVKGAAYYRVYRYGALIAEVTGTSFKDTGVTGGVFAQYQVEACSYSQSAGKSAVCEVFVPKTFAKLTLKKLIEQQADYANKDVTLEKLSIQMRSPEGSDLYLMAENGGYSVYLRVKSYQNSVWKATRPKGSSVAGLQPGAKVKVNGRVTGAKDGMPVIVVDKFWVSK